MRNISFALTTRQVRNKTKTITRRLGWKGLQPGTLLQPVKQAQGLKKGKKVRKVDGPIRVINVRREQLVMMMLRRNGKDECRREGFPDLSPRQFVAMFMKHHRCGPGTFVTRIEFEYVEAK